MAQSVQSLRAHTKALAAAFKGEPATIEGAKRTAAAERAGGFAPPMAPEHMHPTLGDNLLDLETRSVDTMYKIDEVRMGLSEEMDVKTLPVQIVTLTTLVRFMGITVLIRDFDTKYEAAKTEVVALLDKYHKVHKVKSIQREPNFNSCPVFKVTGMRASEEDRSTFNPSIKLFQMSVHITGARDSAQICAAIEFVRHLLEVVYNPPSLKFMSLEMQMINAVFRFSGAVVHLTHFKDVMDQIRRPYTNTGIRSVVFNSRHAGVKCSIVMPRDNKATVFAFKTGKFLFTGVSGSNPFGVLLFSYCLLMKNLYENQDRILDPSYDPLQQQGTGQQDADDMNSDDLDAMAAAQMDD